MQDNASADEATSSGEYALDFPNQSGDRVTLKLTKLGKLDLDDLKKRGVRHAEVRKVKDYDKLKAVLTTVHTLESLSFPRHQFTTGTFTSTFSMLLPGLQTLSIKTALLNSDVLRCLSENLCSLQHLELVTIVHEEVVSLVTRLKRLEYVKLCHDSRTPLFMEFSTVSRSQGPSVKEFVLSRVRVGDKFLAFVRETLPNLEKLWVELTCRTTKAGIGMIAELTQLRDLRLWGEMRFDKTCMERLSLGLPQLRDLDFYYSGVLPDACFSSLAHMPSLQKLRMPVRVTSLYGWKILTQGCTGLKELHLCGGHLRNSGLSRFAALPSLEVLQLEHCRVKDETLQKLCQSLPKLKALCLCNNLTVSNKVLESVAQMPGLERLVLYNCVNICDCGLMLLSQRTDPLLELTLSRLRISCVGLQYLSCSEGMKSLVYLDIRRSDLEQVCRQRMNSPLVDVVLELPNLETLRCPADVAMTMTGWRQPRPGLKVLC